MNEYDLKRYKTLYTLNDYTRVVLIDLLVVIKTADSSVVLHRPFSVLIGVDSPTTPSQFKSFVMVVVPGGFALLFNFPFLFVFLL